MNSASNSATGYVACLWVKYFNVYGPREQHKGSMASVAFHLNNQMLKRRKSKIVAGSRHFLRDFVYVGDV